MNDSKQTTLLILGHGSSKHPDSSSSVRMHAELLSQRGNFAEVHVAFLKEEPLVKDALEKISSEHIQIVPDFLAEGYFTRQVIPQLLRLDHQPDTVHYCDPVGTHPMMQQLIHQAAMEQIGEWHPEEVSLLLVGHGSTKNAQSKQTLLEHINALNQSSDFSQISDLWLEEPPFVNEWKAIAKEKKVIVLPFLLSDGQHGGWDVPEMLGIEDTEQIHHITHELDGFLVKIAPALGTSSLFVDVIEEVAKSS